MRLLDSKIESVPQPKRQPRS